MAENALADALITAFHHGALPGENEGFDEKACANAAAFTLSSAMQRLPGQPAITIETVIGEAQHRHMRIAIINDDMPFLVDSIAATITDMGLAIDRMIHPVVSVRRDSAGHLLALSGDEAEGEKRESVIYLEVERADARVRKQLSAALSANLADVAAAVADWTAMQALMAQDADGIPDGERAALLRWFKQGNLTLLGHELHLADGSVTSKLGISRVGSKTLLAAESLDRAFAWFDGGGIAPLIIKANFTSTVHRRVPLDLVLVPQRDAGKIVALSLHAGIWTSAALAAPPERVPLLRMHLEALSQKFGFDATGHAGKALSHALTSLPHDLLLTFSSDDLERVALTFMSLADRPRPKLLSVKASLARHLFTFVWLPRDDLSTGRRLAIEAMLVRMTGAKILSRSVALDDSDVATLRYVLDLRGVAAEPDSEAPDSDAPDSDAMDAALKIMVRGWLPAVESELAALGEEGRAAALAARYADNFPASYRAMFGSGEAALDILRLRQLGDSAERSARLYRLADDAGAHLRLKLYSRRGAIALSDAVPVLENFGFTVLEEVQTPLADGDQGFVHDFLLGQGGDAGADALLARADTIETAIADVLQGKAEDDAFNRLIAATALAPHAAIWLRAWFRYLRQTGLGYGLETVVDALHDAPAVTHALVRLFTVRHDPGFAGDRDAETAAALATIATGLTAVSAIDDDRLLRLFRSLIMAILRTNAFAPAGDVALAFKIDSAGVPGLPAPLPWREIFVYSPRVEGIHLRAGPVARGGLRWSDRRDDFRTEILGLMKAQRVKNAVIVPTGAKGGFFPKNLPNPAVDRDAWLAEGKASYQIFIRTLLSITDNIVDGKTVHPADIVVLDGEDPYFVVAADKGTASYSDTANAIALEQGFWLGDAFASGGSVGYDHKAMGITAKGGWVSVQRHFAEMGVDVQSEPVRVAGCGDMSGDVFGNGLLLSKSVKLVAAFDHRHIFLDPDPNAAAAWAERKRLFDLPRSSWDDYDRSLISEGGGIFPRSLKSIPLSPQIQALLATGASVLEPGQLITAILQAPVDLFWFGGIGTYIKSAGENNLDVGDPANDALRINASGLRCRVIGEGANLGVTQAARIDFALAGGRINTDFIDNSAGVDCSDNEVNIKIGLDSAMRQGSLAAADRNALLASMTDAVGALVLEDNRLQALALSIAEAGGAAALPPTLRIIEKFEETGRLDRAVEGIAANDELLRRMSAGQGLTRPELAVMLATAKLALQDAIEHSSIPADPAMDDVLFAAFPPQMQTDFAGAIRTHPLRGPIIATKLANRIVNRMGLIHPFELAEEEGSSLGHVAMAFVAGERLFDLPALWARLDSDGMPETCRLQSFERTASLLRSQMADILRASSEGAYAGELVSELAPAIAALTASADSLLSVEARAQTAQQVSDLVATGAPEQVARMITQLSKMDGAVGLSRLSGQTGGAVEVLTRAFSDIGGLLGLDWAQLTAARLIPSDPWERLLVAGLARDFQQMRLEFLVGAKGADPVLYVASWADTQAARIAEFRTLVARAQRASQPGVAMLAQIASQARILLGR